MKYCEEYAALLDAFVDGELTPGEADRVREHLKACGGCRSYVDAALAIRDAFPALENVDVPAGFADGVMASIRAETHKKRKTPWGKVLLPMAACLAIVVALQSIPVGHDNTTADSAAVNDRAQADAFFYTAESAPAEDSSAEADSGGEEERADVQENELLTSSSKESGSAGSAPAAPRAVLEDFAADSGTAPADAPMAMTSPDSEAEPDIWEKYGNVVFASTVYLTPEFVGDALDGYAGSPYSTDEGVIGVGYALEQAEFEHILYDVLDYPLGPMLNQNRTTELSCIVVTDAACAVG